MPLVAGGVEYLGHLLHLLQVVVVLIVGVHHAVVLCCAVPGLGLKHRQLLLLLHGRLDR